jgi:hypothetical protein
MNEPMMDTPPPASNRRWIWIAAGGAALLAVGCCAAFLAWGAYLNATEPSTPKAEIDATATDSKPVAGPGHDGSSRSKPAPAGATVSTDDMAFTVTGLTDPADQIVVESYELNGTPEPGKRYVMVSVSVLCQATEKCEFGLYNLKMVGSEGIEREYESVSDVPDLLQSTDFFNGATVKGNVVYQIGKDETDLILVYSVFLSKDIYLAVE